MPTKRKARGLLDEVRREQVDEVLTTWRAKEAAKAPPTKANPAGPCERLLRAAVREYRKIRDVEGRGHPGLHLELILRQLVLWSHDFDRDVIPGAETVVAAEVDGALVVVDGGDSLDDGWPCHLVERVDVVAFGPAKASAR